MSARAGVVRLLGCAAVVLLPVAARAQTAPVVGTVIVAHGADSVWNGDVLALAQECHPGGPVEVAFLMGPAAATHRFQDAVERLVARGATRVVVVPLLVSSHSGHYEQARWLAGATDSLDAEMHEMLGMSGLERPHTTVPITVTRGLDDSPELAHVLARRANALAKDAGRHALFLVGHGPNTSEDYAAWMANLRVVVGEVARATGAHDVRADLVQDDAPVAVRAEAVLRIRDVIALQAEATHQPVLVVPILIAHGSIGEDKLRKDLAGLPIVYEAAPLLPDAELARWVERRVREAAP